MKTKRSYSDEDVQRWFAAKAESLPIEYRRIIAGDTQRGRRISRFSRKHESAGLTQIALGQYGKALGHFSAAAGVWAYLLERYVAGEEIDRELLNRIGPQSFLLGLAGNDEATLHRLSTIYEIAFPDARTGKNSMHWMGLVTAAFVKGRVALASEWIGSFPPTLNPATAVYYSSLLEQNEEEFAASLLRRAERWKTRLQSEGLSRFPDAVCDHPQIGSIRLAERLWGRRPDVDLAAARIPPEIFDAVAEPVEGTL